MKNNNAKTCNESSYFGCKLNTYKDNDKCALHCKKSSYSYDFHSSLLSDFYEEFKKYVISELFSHKDRLYETLSRKDVENYFKTNNFNNQEYNYILKKELFVPSKIIFPCSDSGDNFNYTKILNLFGEIHFNYCEFNDTHLELKNIKVFFQDCIFHNEWTLYDYDLLENIDEIIYQQCTFHKNVTNYNEDDKKALSTYRYSQFDYFSTFKIGLELNKCLFQKLYSIQIKVIIKKIIK